MYIHKTQFSHARLHIHVQLSTQVLKPLPVIPHWHLYFLSVGSATHEVEPAQDIAPPPMLSAPVLATLQDQYHLPEGLVLPLLSHQYH